MVAAVMRALVAPLLLVLAASLTLAPAAGAAAAKGPDKVQPKLQVTAARVTGTSLRFTVTVTFSPPSGTSAAAACKGKLGLSEKVKHGKAPHWSGRLKAMAGLCVAPVKGRLPAKLFKHRVAFELAFAGNDKVAAFSRSSQLRLSAPKSTHPGGRSEASSPAGAGPGPGSPGPEPSGPQRVVYTAADGYWEGAGLWDTGSGGSVAFLVEDGVISKVNSFSTFLMRCEKTDSLPKVTYLYRELNYYQREVGLGPDGKFHDEYTERIEDPDFDTEVPWLVHGQLGPSSGTMVFEAHDAHLEEHFPAEPEHSFSECHASITLAVGKH